MMKNRILCSFLSLILILSFPIVGIGTDCTTMDISSAIDSNIIVAKNSNGGATSPTYAYDKDLVSSREFTIDSIGIDFELCEGFDTGNDAIKISANSDKEISFNDALIKKVYFIAATGGEEASLNAQANFEDNSTKDNPITIYPLIQPSTISISTNNNTSDTLSLKNMNIFGTVYKYSVGTDKAYFNAYSFENDAKKLSRVIFKNTSSVDVYILAISTTAYNEDEMLGDVPELFEKYEGVKFTEIGTNETSISELEKLYSGLVAGLNLGKTEEPYSEANKTKVSDMIEGYNLYKAWMEQKEIVDIYDYSKITEDNFSELKVDAEINHEENMPKAAEAYEKLKELDYSKLEGLCEKFEIPLDDIKIENFDSAYEHIKVLSTKYEEYLAIEVKKAENDFIYDEYSQKSKTSLSSDDLKFLNNYIENSEALLASGAFVDKEKLDYIKFLKKAIENYSSSERPFIPIKMPYNADIIGKTGETARDNWAYGIKEANKRFGLSGDANRTLAKNIENDAISINEGGYAKDKGNYIEGDTYYKYKIESTSLSVGKDDALSVSMTPATLKTSGRPIEKIALLKYAFLNPGGVPVNYTVNYTDGTSVTTTSKEGWGDSELEYVAWYGKASDGDWNRNDQYLLPNADTKVLEAYTSSSSNYNSSVLEVTGGMKSFQVLYLPVDKTKSVENITINSNYGVDALYFLAATEIPLTDTQLKTKIQEIKAKGYTEESITVDNAPEIALAKSYADELVFRLKYDEKDEAVEWIYNLYNSIFTAKGEVERYDRYTLEAKLEFSFAVSLESLKSALSVTKNDEAVSYSGLTLSDDGKTATFYIPCDEKWGDNINIEVSTSLSASEIEKNLLVKLVVPYTVAEYLSVNYNGGKISVTNNSKVPADYNLYFTYYNKNTGEVIASDKFEASCGDTPNEHKVNFEPTDGFDVYIYVIDDNNKHITYYSAISENTDNVLENAEYKEIYHQPSDNKITVSGFTSSRLQGKTVNLKIEDASDNIIAFLSEKTDSKGGFLFNVEFPDDIIVNEGYIKITLMGDDFATPYIDNTSVYLSKSTSKENAINAIKNAATSDLAVTALKNAENILGLSSVMFTQMADSLGDRLISSDVSNEFNAGDLNGAKKIILRELILEAYSQGKTNLVLKDGNLLYDDFIEYKKIDENNVTLYLIFTDLLTQAGKEKAVLDLNGKTLNTVEDLRNELSITIANSVLNNCSKGGYEKYICLFTNANASKLGIDISNYTNRADKTALLDYLATRTITNITELEAGVKAYVTPQDPNDFGGGGSYGGGHSGPSTGGFAMTPDVLNTNQNTTPSSQFFNDLPENHWAYSYIADMKAKNIINGDEKGNVNPDNNITRAEFIKILVASVYGTELGTMEGEKVFNDVNADDWYFKYVIAAYKNGIIKGDENNNFNPNAYVTREDMCVMLYRMAGASDIANSPKFSDSKDISEYAVSAVTYLSEKGIINGFSDNLFMPKANATRAQCAKIISVYLSK